MARKTMIVDVAKPSEVEAAEAWLSANRAALTSVVREGCGCCVWIWRLEGPAAVLATIPLEFAATSDWNSA